MVLLAIDWSVVGVKAAQFILSFSILVVLHEMGHFLPAKWFKCRVEKFYLFFNPWFSLAKKQIGETEYGLGWIPMGGYVKISGMIDESMDKEQMKQPAQPWEFRSKPAWQRLIIMLGGITVNVILAIIIFILITWVWGEEYLPPQNVKYGMAVDSLGRSVGLKDGDVVMKVGQQPVKDARRTVPQIVVTDANDITVLREGKELNLPIPESMIKSLNKSGLSNFADIRYLPVIDVAEKSNAEKAGLKKGDRVIAVDSVATPFFQDFQRQLKKKKTGTVHLTVLRNNDTLRMPVQLTDKGTIGVGLEKETVEQEFRMETKRYSFLESFPAGFNRCWQTLSNYMTGLKQLFTGKANPNDSVGGPLSIGNIFPAEWNWKDFWTLTAIFSIILAFMNVLPIPGLDGGHALFTIYEMVTGHKPGDKFIEYAQMVGMVLLLGLMLYAFGLDIWRIFK
jgi:regulator of sigma E protease